ncbi:MAG: glycosyltransferase [Acidobacteriota bacterium]|nr:glycosyltransferase [Acidobacteriota bacterium]
MGDTPETRAEELRSRTLAGLNEYSARLEQQRAELRPQRAWRIMLAIRKTYALLFRRGLSGKLELARWLVRIPFAGFGDLSAHEIVWPELNTYLPEETREVIRDLRSVSLNAPPQTRYDVVVLAIIDFDFRFQRPQQIAAEFARRGHRVVWISPSRFLGPGSPDPYTVSQLRENIWEIHLRSTQPDVYLGELRPAMLASLSEALSHVYRDFAISESCVLVQLPFWRQLALALRAAWDSPIVYDCMDDWDSFRNMGRYNNAQELELARECDLLVATAARLAAKFEERGLHPLLARNAADFDFFQTAAPTSLLHRFPRPIVGYFGAIADWLDLDLIAAVARLRPAYSFVLIGDVHQRDLSQLEALPNVFLLGRKPYADIPGYLHGFDVCTIPFLLNSVTEATDPVKLYEYFSLGKPVVATDMPELEQCAELLYIAGGAEPFAAQIDAALAESDSNLAAWRRAFAAANTWEARVSAIDVALRPLFPRVSVLVITYNSAEYVDLCLDSIRRNTSYPNYEVIVIDNHSTDGTADLLRKQAAADPRVRVHPRDTNLGFAAANNLAAREASGEYFILLNADTMVTSGWIGRLLRHLRADSALGMVSPVTNFAGNEIKIDVRYRDRVQMEEFALDLARQKQGQRLNIPMAPLFCALVSRDLWNRIGELDEGFEIGMFEDDDFCHRIRQAGYEIAVAEDCFIHHFGQGSFSMLPSKDYNDLFERNLRRFENKWGIQWKPHQPRPGVRPAFEETRYRTADFGDQTGISSS